CAYCAMKITSTIRASTPAIRAVRMPLIRMRSMAVRSGRAGLARGGTVGGRDGRGRAAPGGGEVCAGMALFPFQGQGQAEARAPRAPIVAGAGRWAVPRSPRLRRSGVAPQPPADVRGAACDGDDD